MKTSSLLLASFVLLCAIQSSSAAAATSTLTVTLSEQNGSGESGTATLTQTGSDVTVVLDIKGAPATTAQPAHIHDGTCAKLTGVAYPLTSATNGKSTTVVKDLTIDKLLGGTYAINVHESADNLGKYVACGNIVAK
ncbi:MAG TPA: CHRD domain-containing protein [Candidatus Babeliales bacterium]|nr:CHRD domain-containing protein [Candidatus Babeliales bacterium]